MDEESLNIIIHVEHDLSFLLKFIFQILLNLFQPENTQKYKVDFYCFDEMDIDELVFPFHSKVSTDKSILCGT